MDRDSFESWLESYVRPWEARNPEPMRDIWAEDATYWWGPYNDPRHGREAIHAHHVNAIDNQEDIKFKYEILATSRDTGVARFWLNLVNRKTGLRSEYDGIFAVCLNADNRCTLFQEWYHSREVDGS